MTCTGPGRLAGRPQELLLAQQKQGVTMFQTPVSQTVLTQSKTTTGSSPISMMLANAGDEKQKEATVIKTVEAQQKCTLCYRNFSFLTTTRFYILSKNLSLLRNLTFLTF